MDVGRIAIKAAIDAAGITDGVKVSEQAMGRLAKTAKALGGILAGAFAAQKVGAFMQDAVATAMEAEAVWNRLGGTLRTVGVDFAAVEGEISAAARALQDVTTVGDEDFADILGQLTTISRDYAGSLANVETVANLAAGAQIDLKTASKLVGRAMIGDATALKRYGIVVEEGADAMAVLRAQFAGMAENEAATMQGRLLQLGNEWGDLKEAIGGVLVDMGGGTSVMVMLIDVVKSLTEWVSRNSAGIKAWASAGIDVAVTSARALYGAVTSLGNGIVGLSSAIVSGAIRPFAWLLQGFASLSRGIEKFWGVIGNDTAQARVAAQTATLQRYADNLKHVADVTSEVAVQSFATMRDPFGQTADSAAAAGDSIKKNIVAPVNLATQAAAALAKKLAGIGTGNLALAGVQAAVAPKDQKLKIAGRTSAALPPEWTAAQEAMLRTFEDLRYGAFELAVGWRQVQQEFTRPAETLDAAGQMVSGALLGIAQQFSPMGLMAKVVAGALSRLQPTIEALLEPVTMVGELIGELLAPMLEMLIPPLKFVAKILSYLGTAIGWLVRAIGKAIDKIPGVSGKGLIKAGQKMMDGAEAMRKRLEEAQLPDAAEKAAESLNRLNDSVVNAVQGFKIAGYRHAATMPGQTPTGGTTTDPGDTTGGTTRPGRREPEAQHAVNLGGVTIQTTGDGRATYRSLWQEIDRRTRATGVGRDFFHSLPRPA